MQIVINNEAKMACIWLTSAEDTDAEIRAALARQIEGYHKAGYTVVVYASGSGDLFCDTLALLQHNRDVSARKAP